MELIIKPPAQMTYRIFLIIETLKYHNVLGSRGILRPCLIHHCMCDLLFEGENNITCGIFLKIL